MSFGNNLQALRNEKGLSQKELASQLGVTTGTIAEWESDESAPNLAEFSRLSKILGVSMDKLLAEETATPTEEPSEVVQSTSSPVEHPTEQPVPMPPVTKKRKKAGLFIGIAAGIIALAVAVFLIFFNVPFANNATAIEAADASVVTLFCYDYEGKLAATGSGFVAFNGKTIITNYHVMTSAYTCKISTNQDISYEVSKILCYSKEQDIAILELSKDTGLQPLKLGDSSAIKKGETVVAIGSPLGIKNTVSTGVLSGRLMDANMDVLQFTAPISSGSSGGALFDNNGNVIGITYASYVAGQNLNLAIPIELAINLYENKGSAKSVSTICLEEYPYITYLSEYKNAPVVTLADLKLNPQKYDEKVVRLSIYISSWGKDRTDKEYWWDSGNWYLAEQSDVSLDYEYDGNRAIPARLGITYQDSPVIVCYTDRERSKYVDDSVRPGDCIEIVAYFEFKEKGELLFPDDPESDMRSPYDMANLESILIWKS